MEKCNFIGINFIPGKMVKTAKSKAKTANIYERPNQVFVTLKLASGKICNYEIANKVCKYFRKQYVSRSLVEAFEKRARIEQVIFVINHGKLIIK